MNAYFRRIVLFVCGMFLASYLLAGGINQVTRSELISSSESCDSLRKVIQEALDTSLSAEGYLFLFESSEVDACMRRDREIQLQLSHLMIQGHRNREHRLDISSFVHFARQNSLSEEFYVSSRALNTLAVADLSADVDLIYGIAMKQNRLFRSAVLSLIQMCNSESSDAVSQLMEDIDESKLREIIEMKTKFERFASRTGWCDKSSIR